MAESKFYINYIRILIILFCYLFIHLDGIKLNYRNKMDINNYVDINIRSNHNIHKIRISPYNNINELY